MDATIALILAQDGLTNGLIYALLALAILLVFIVTRVLFVPQGEFVVLGALTFGAIQQGSIPGTIWLLAILGIAMAVMEAVQAWRHDDWRGGSRRIAFALAAPVVGIGLTHLLLPVADTLAVQALLALLLVVPMGPMLYSVAFRPLAHSSILVLLFVAVAAHYVLQGLALYFFGPEGARMPPFIPGRIDAGFTRISWQLIIVLVVSAILMIALWAFMERTLIGRALRATAVNRLGARLVGIRTELAGSAAFTVAALIGVLSGILIGPITPIYYDTGFLISLKGFVGAVVGGMVGFPLAVVGAIIVGLFEAFAAFFASGFKDAIVFALLVPILIWRSYIDPHAHEEEDEA